MMRWKVGAGLMLAAGLAVLPLRAQEMGKKDEMAKPAKGPSQLVLDQWNEVSRKLVAMAEDFPEDKYDYKPTPAQANGQKPPAEEDPKRANFKSKAEIVAFVKKCFADGATAIKTKGDKGMSDWVVDPTSKDKMQVADLAYGFIEHSGEHYGQLVVYYRLSGLVPPESRPKK